MSVEQWHDRAPAGRDAGPTYFVGRRQFEAAEIYAVSDRDVHRLRSARRHGEPSLDWQGSSAAQMELSHLLISSVAKQRPSRDLQALFAVSVLSDLSDDGFVMDSDEIWGWLELAADERDFEPIQSQRRFWPGRLRTLWPGAQTPSTDV
jgi:hypothetical protein